MKTNFHMKVWAPALALNGRPKVIRKWPIVTKDFKRVILCKPHKVSLGITDDRNFNQTIVF